jgi:hypothetical protein
VRKPYTCPHPDEQATLRKRIATGGTAMVGHQCGECGRLVGQWVKLERVPKWRDLPAWDHELEERWDLSERRRLGEYREWRVQQDGVVAFGRDTAPGPNFWEKYNEYLNSPEWREKRELVLRRANGICEGCGKVNATQVHHLNYAHVGREMLFELVAVCDACHEIIHGRKL